MSNPVEKRLCRYCAKVVVKNTVRVDGHFRWVTVPEGFYYCPKAGGECWHEPKEK
jgi:hypothetical protein